MARENKEIIIIGDVNSNYLDKKCDKPFKNLSSLNGFIQLIDSPTRTTTHSETLIDVILSNKPLDTKVIPATLSDHDAISCNRKIKNQKESSETIKCRNYANYQPEHLRNYLKQTSFDKVYNEKNPNNAWNVSPFLCLPLMSIVH